MARLPTSSTPITVSGITDTTRICPERVEATRDLSELRTILPTFRSSAIETTLDEIELVDDGELFVRGEEVPSSQVFLERLAKLLGCPSDWEVVRAQLHREKKRRGDLRLTICLSREIAVNVYRGDYRPARSSELLSWAQTRSDLRFRRAIVADRGVELSFLFLGAAFEPVPGDRVGIGIRISNSETGFRGAKGSLEVAREESNCAIVLPDSLGHARWSHDRRMRYDSILAAFFRGVNRLGCSRPDLRPIYERALKARVDACRFRALWRRLRQYVKASVVDEILRVTQAERLFLMAGHECVSTGARVRTPKFSVYEAHNYVAEAAKEQVFEVRKRLEEISGSILVR